MTEQQAIRIALEALGPEAPECCGCRTEWEIAITALRQALEKKEKQRFNPDWDAMAVMVEEQQRMAKRIEELEQQPANEPVACVEYIPCCTDKTCSKCKAAIKPELVCVCGAVWEGQELIYTTPQRTWVGLTDEEVDGFHNWKDCTWSTNELVRHVETKLRSKNT